MIEAARKMFRTILCVVCDFASLLSASIRSRAQLSAENLFLRKQLAMYQERRVKPRRADDGARITLVALSCFLKWRSLLLVVKPETLRRWHRKGFRLFWRWKSRRPGRPPIPDDLQLLIAAMAAANRTWGRRTDRLGTQREAGDSCISANGSTIYAAASDTTSEDRVAGVEHLCAESRSGAAGL
jgi:hypothetical protein